jgi:hypothetical protein
MSLDGAHVIGVFFDATELAVRETVLKYANKLKKEGKQVKMLGYFRNDVGEADFPFPFFTKKQVDWAYRPKGEEIDRFLSRHYDLFFCLQPNPSIIADYVAALVNASLRIGPVTGNIQDYDLMIDEKPDAPLEQFIRHAEGILKKTHVRPEPAAV